MIKTEVISRRHIGFIPSASGIEVVDDKIYIIGDDSAYLYRLGPEYQQFETIKVFRSRHKPGEKMPKLLKADLEALCTVNWQGRNLFLLMGSGSISPDRERGYLINPLAEGQIFTLNLTPLYDHLRNELKVNDLNIEGVTATGSHVYLVQRGNVGGQNLMFRYDKDAFIAFLLEQASKPPTPEVQLFQLQEFNNVMAGFSGLSTLDERHLLCTVSVENTASTYSDGEILGSYVGIIDITAKTPEVELAMLMDKGNPIVEKAESIAMLKRLNDNEIITLVVTDNDLDPSGLMEVKLTLR